MDFTIVISLYKTSKLSLETKNVWTSLNPVSISITLVA